MSANGVDDIAEKIKKTIDSALESGDFQNLSQNIQELAGGVAKDVSQGIKRGMNTSNATRQGKPRRGEEVKDASYREVSSSPAKEYPQVKQEEHYYPQKVSKVGPILQIVGGAAALTMFASVSIITLISMIFGKVGIATVVILLGMLGVSGLLFWSGTNGLSEIGRFKKYTSLKGQETIPVKKLAALTNRTITQTQKDLKKMIARNWFYEGHLDEEEGYFLLTDRAYDEYREAQQSMESRKAEQALEAERQKAEAAAMPEHVQKMIEDGKRHITNIRACNDSIPDEAITAKLDHMEMLVTRIFDEVKAHPENAADMRKMMNYYLPLTEKLLNAYRELDRQPIQGENITYAKKEIEASIDTLNTAFERFFDSMYADRAMDISTDISVLNTMLAQEGLKKSAFESMKEKRRDE